MMWELTLLSLVLLQRVADQPSSGFEEVVDSESYVSWNEDEDHEESEDGGSYASLNGSLEYLREHPPKACEFCHGRVPSSPLLCDYCQGWNDARHTFSCLPILAQSLHQDYSGMIRPPDNETAQASRDAINHAKVMTINSQTSDPDCLVCSFIVRSAKSYIRSVMSGKLPGTFRVANGGPYHLNPYLPQGSGASRHRWPLQIDESEGRECSIQCVMLLAIQVPDIYSLYTKEDLSHPRCSPTRHDNRTVEVQVELGYAESAVGLKEIRSWDKPFLDRTLLKSWIDCCHFQHQGLCRQEAEPLPDHMRVIDTVEMNVTPVSNITRYAALSYVWAMATNKGPIAQLTNAVIPELERPGSLYTLELPSLILDAITLCRDLDTRYLWVDRLCIVHDDSVGKQAQINAMGTIYGSAHFTIVAAVDSSTGSGLPGVSDTPRQWPPIHKELRSFNNYYRCVDHNMELAIDTSRWNSRGWTFQERLLSRRYLFITNRQAYFLCAQSTHQEELGFVRGFTNNQSRSLGRSRFSRLQEYNWSDGDREEAYFRMLEEYSGRTLSCDSDILNALAGVDAVLEREYVSCTRFGHLESYFLVSLLWRPHECFGRRTGIDLPSWTWPAWTGGKHLMHDLDSYDNGSSCRYRYMRNLCVGALVAYHIVNSEGHVQAIRDWNWFDKSMMPFEAGETSDQLRLAVPNPWKFSRYKIPSVFSVLWKQGAGRVVTPVGRLSF